MILAFAVRTASVLVGICSGCGAFVTLPTVGIIGVVRIRTRATGCVLIGPVAGLILGMLDNSFLPGSFKTKPGAWRYLTPIPRRQITAPARDGAGAIIHRMPGGVASGSHHQAHWFQATDHLRTRPSALAAYLIREIYANEQYCSSISSVLRHGDLITAPYRHLSVTESVVLPPDVRGLHHGQEENR